MLGSLTPEQIIHVLQSQTIGRIGCCAKGEVYVVPVTYAYSEGYIYAHSQEGRKISMMRENPNVCFEVEAVENMANWRSVIVWGKYEELRSENERQTGMQILVNRFMPLVTSATVMPSHGTAHPPEVVEKGKRAVVYRIKIDEPTGRFEVTPGKH
jgi:uncharacterized protein